MSTRESNAAYYAKHRERILAKKEGQRRARGDGVHHGLTTDLVTRVIYRTWQFVKDRCHNPRSVHYPRYGGQGIVMAECWRDDPVAFAVYMGPKPTPRHSIDRFPNKAGNYEPGNVRWATYEEQNQNRSNTKLVADDIPFIRHWLTRGHPHKHIAAVFDVNASLISNIGAGRAWANIPSADRR